MCTKKCFRPSICTKSSSRLILRTTMNRIPLLNDPLNGQKPLEAGTTVYVRDSRGSFAKAIVVQIFRTKQTPKKKKFFTYKVYSLGHDGGEMPLRYHRRARGKKSNLHCFLEDEFRKAYPQSALLPALAVAAVEAPVEAPVQAPVQAPAPAQPIAVYFTANKRRVPKRRRVRQSFKYKTKTGDLCPFCTFRTGTMKRSMLEHLCGPRSHCRDLAHRPSSRVIHTNSFTKTGDTCHNMLKSLGFSNPAKYVDEYTQSYGAQCPHCDYKSIAKRKVTRHIQQVHRPRQVTL